MTIYVVRAGDSLTGIAEHFGITVEALVRENGIADPDRIFAGQKLQIPQRDGQIDEQGEQTESLSLERLQSIMPNLPDAGYLSHLNTAMAEAEINTALRQAAFLAQLAHESGELRWFEEFADGWDYEGREDLGNIYEGDGPRYKGRGPIQLTGRYNYRVAGEALGLDLEGYPEQVATPEVGFRTACWYWTSRDLNSYADAGDFDTITYLINGGYNHKESRDYYYRVACGVLGA